MILRINPYLMLEGNAREAIQFYEKALDAKVIGIQTFGEMPQNPEFPLPPEARDRIAHALLKIGESDLMISDTFPGQPLHKGNHVTICITTNDTQTTKKIYEALQEGGQVGMPLQETFWSPAYGIVTDKFGVTFHITTESSS